VAVLSLSLSLLPWHPPSSAPVAAASPADEADAAAHGSALTLASQAPGEISVPAVTGHPAYTVYTPGSLPGVAPSPVTLLVLHGMGGTGPEMAATVLPEARAQGWTVLAPTIPYGDWRDPSQLAGEVLGLQPQLATLLESVRAETGVAVGPRVLLFGFSRGAQAALRFAMLYPDNVQAVVACSAGTYTVPTATMKTSAGASISVPLPYGVADLEQRSGRGVDAARMSTVRFLIGVGANDNLEGDVPRQWDPFLGKDRVERAERFAASLAAMGMPAQVVVVPDTGHELSAGMMTQVSSFLTEAASELRAQIAATPSGPSVSPAGRATS